MMAAKGTEKQADKLVEKVQENVVTSHMKGGTTTPSVPNLTCIVPCEDDSHRVTLDLSKGLFRVNVREFFKLSVSQVSEYSETEGTVKDCGPPKCCVSLVDGLYNSV